MLACMPPAADVPAGGQWREAAADARERERCLHIHAGHHQAGVHADNAIRLVRVRNNAREVSTNARKVFSILF
eukprot:7330511-Pyramimonas_sp.AAC.1